MKVAAFFLGMALISVQDVRAQSDSDAYEQKLKKIIKQVAQSIKDSKVKDFLDDRGRVITSDPKKEKNLLDAEFAKIKKVFEDKSIEAGRLESSSFSRRIRNMEAIAIEAGLSNGYMRCRLYEIADNSNDFYQGAPVCNPLPGEKHTLCKISALSPIPEGQDPQTFAPQDEREERDVAVYTHLKTAQECRDYTDSKTWASTIALIKKTKLPRLNFDDKEQMDQLGPMVNHFAYMESLSDLDQPMKQPARSGSTGN